MDAAHVAPLDERVVVAAACSLIAKAKKRTSRGRKQDRPRVAGGSMKSAMSQRRPASPRLR